MSKDKTPATLTVDVLKILNDAEEVLRNNGFKEIPDDLELSCAAVAELIEADTEYDRARSAWLASTWLADDSNQGEFLAARLAWDRRAAALARVRGAA